ncbi:ribonuclease H-like domain-containing protein [Tanacetum coccineum]
MLFLTPRDGIDSVNGGPTGSVFNRVCLKGIKLGGDMVNSIHMFYADAVVFVGQCVRAIFNSLFHVLDCFYKVSGLRINMSKSKIMGVHVDDEKDWDIYKVGQEIVLAAHYPDAWNNLGQQGIAFMSLIIIEVGMGDDQILVRKKWCADGNPRGGNELDQLVRLEDDLKGVVLSSNDDRWVWELEREFASTPFYAQPVVKEWKRLLICSFLVRWRGTWSIFTFGGQHRDNKVSVEFERGIEREKRQGLHKFNTDGSLSRYKARLVVNGRKIVFMHQPPGFVDPRHPDYVCHLQRSLYGLKQAPRAWFQHFASYATRVGFQHSKTDLFIFHRGTDIAYFFYVDDIILTASSTAFLKRVISSLHGEFSMTDLGSLKLFSWCFCSTFYCRHHATNKSEPNNDDHASNVGCFPTLFKKIHPTSSSTVTASGSSTGSSQ